MVSDKKSYPYMAWVLSTSFKPKQIEITNQGYRMKGYTPTDKAEGRHYNLSDLYESKDLAVKNGMLKLDEMREALAKRKAAIDKKAAELAKHA